MERLLLTKYYSTVFADCFTADDEFYFISWWENRGLRILRCCGYRYGKFYQRKDDLQIQTDGCDVGQGLLD